MTVASAQTGQETFPVEAIRADFPILSQRVRDRDLVYLDNAATTHKPRAVIEAVSHYYERDNSNVHRGVHALSERATVAYEAARTKIQRFIGAASPKEIVFLRGTTEAINLVAFSFGELLEAGDEIVITTMEHHSNIVPWQLLARRRGIGLKVAPVTDRGELDMVGLEALLGPRTKLLSIVHMSNALGTVNPVAEIVELAHGRGIPVLLDGAQAISHMSVDVQALGCDFYAFSGHKMYGPTGIGVLYGRSELLETLPPYQGGGDMIASVSFEKTTYSPLPTRLEAGTHNIAGAIGLGAAIDYMSGVGLDRIATYEQQLCTYAMEALAEVPGLRFIGEAAERASVISFVLEGVHPHDIGTILDMEGVAIRTGHHCAQPVMQRFGVPATARASFAMYNTTPEIDALVSALHKVREVFGL